MAVELTIANLSRIHRLLKNAMRASRAAIMISKGGLAPKSVDVSVLRTAIEGATDIKDAAKAIVENVNENVQ
jgi:hypothetical protein